MQVLLLALLSAGPGDLHVGGDLTVDGIFSGSASISHKSFSIELGLAGVRYMSGFYDSPAADTNLTQASTTQTCGVANNAYGAHAFMVAGGAGAATGGSGAVTVTVSGVSITDAGVRNDSDSEILVADITAMSADDYAETSNRWLGQVTYTLDVGSTGHTAYAFDFNYGMAIYDDRGERAHTIREIECIYTSGANETALDIELVHHMPTGWTYHATAFEPGPSAVASLAGDYGTNVAIANGSEGSWRHYGLTTAVTEGADEGCLIRITTAVNNSIDVVNCHVGVTY